MSNHFTNRITDELNKILFLYCKELTNEFSKKIENHSHAIALHFMYYNFVRIHKTLRITPAMKAGLTKKLWTIEDLIKLLN